MASLIPLESNPEVMTKFMRSLGVPEPWSIIDVYGLDADSLAAVKRPAPALILLHPLSKQEQAYTDEIEAKIKEKGQKVSPNLFHMQQRVSNACGTIALIHAILNNLDQIKLEEGGMKDFWERAKDLSFEEKGILLEETAGGIIRAHEISAQEGQTEAPEENAPVYHHFVAFVEKDGDLYELDGRKNLPINHGPTTKETVLEDAAKVCLEYMARDPEDLRFSTMALVAAN